jgi:hypothetical protein
MFKKKIHKYIIEQHMSHEYLFNKIIFNGVNFFEKFDGFLYQFAEITSDELFRPIMFNKSHLLNLVTTVDLVIRKGNFNISKDKDIHYYHYDKYDEVILNNNYVKEDYHLIRFDSDVQVPLHSSKEIRKCCEVMNFGESFDFEIPRHVCDKINMLLEVEKKFNVLRVSLVENVMILENDKNYFIIEDFKVLK